MDERTWAGGSTAHKRTLLARVQPFLLPGLVTASSAAAIWTVNWMTFTWVRLFGLGHFAETKFILFLLSLALVVSAAVLPYFVLAKRWRWSGAAVLVIVFVGWMVGRMKYGVLDYSVPPCALAAPDAFLMTRPAPSGRMQATRERLASVGVHAEPVFGYDADGVVPGMPDGLPRLKRVHVAIILSQVRLWRRLSTNASAADWALFLEDDVMPLPGFTDNVRRAICQFGDTHDVLWLDAKAAPGFSFYRVVGTGTVAMLYKRASLARVASAVDASSKDFRDLLHRPGPALQIDGLLSQVCARGLLKCAAFPMATEIGDLSSIPY